MEMRAASALTSSTSARGEANPYRLSMHRLLEYVGLENYGSDTARMPERSLEETALIEAHLAEVTEAERRHAERQTRVHPKKVMPNGVMDAIHGCGRDASSRGPPTIFLSFEESLEWRAFLAGTPNSQRHAATVRRRLSLTLWKAHSRRLCLLCWFPHGMCICDQLEAHRESLPQAVLDSGLHVTMLLHAEEVLRSTNSGHIAAYVLGAPVRVWGLPEDDVFLQNLPPTAVLTTGTDDGRGTVHNVSLYPEKGSPTVADFVAHTIAAPASSSTLSSSPTQTTSSSGPVKMHLLLSDSTWGQALSLNRHINRTVPRVSLLIEEDYESLFGALRKRTRESGVSTLEATSMALRQCVTAMGHAAEAAQTDAVLRDAMRSFVDLKCLLKYTDAQFDTDAVSTSTVTEKRDAVRREEAMQRLAQLEVKVSCDPSARKYLLPPVTNYCYCCDAVVGWHRMPEHVLGKSHRAAVERNPTCKPSAAAREVYVPNFSRQPRIISAEAKQHRLLWRQGADVSSPASFTDKENE